MCHVGDYSPSHFLGPLVSCDPDTVQFVCPTWCRTWTMGLVLILQHNHVDMEMICIVYLVQSSSCKRIIHVLFIYKKNSPDLTSPNHLTISPFNKPMCIMQTGWGINKRKPPHHTPLFPCLFFNNKTGWGGTGIWRCSNGFSFVHPPSFFFVFAWYSLLAQS